MILFKTNIERVKNRSHTTAVLNEITRQKSSAWWLENLEKSKIGCGPINNLSEVFSDPHILAREMVIEMDHPATGNRKARIIASLLNFPRPSHGHHHLRRAHRRGIIRKIGLSDTELNDLRKRKVL